MKIDTFKIWKIASEVWKLQREDYPEECILDKLNELKEELCKTEEGDKSKCSHELLSKEYPSQPYGTCASCGQTVFS